MTHPNHQLVRVFFSAVSKGDLPVEMLSADMAAWTLTSGDTTKEKFLGGVKLLASIFGGSLIYDIDSITAEDDRVVVETKSRGTFVSGEAFSNVHVFLFRVRDGQIAHIAEYMNPVIVADKIVPQMQAAMAAAQSK